MISKKEISDLTESRDKELKLWEDPVYLPEEKEDIEKFEKLCPIDW